MTRIACAPFFRDYDPVPTTPNGNVSSPYGSLSTAFGSVPDHDVSMYPVRNAGSGISVSHIEFPEGVPVQRKMHPSKG